ncbi:MAG TPA: VWA domain-containing protein [Pyrinomonadaceae bacterium]
MRLTNPTPRFLILFLFLTTLLALSLTDRQPSDSVTQAQTRERKVAEPTTVEVIKTDVDLVTVDALVLQKKTARVVGDLTRDDFIVSEDGKPQDITHFSQGSLPLSVLLLIDRGGCLDPFSTQVKRAAMDALERLKPNDEVAVMTYHNDAELLQKFTKDRWSVNFALQHIPPHDESANHCLNKAFYEAATYMEQASNPSGRRVIILITGVTRNFDCPDGPGNKSAKNEVYESGSVVCGLVPITAEQQIENGMARWATRMGKMVHAPTLNVRDLADDTGGEVLEDKPDVLDQTFATLMDHIRSRFSLAYSPTNKLHDGSMRKLKIELKPSVLKARGDLVVKARRSYVAPRS